ncbi:MAG: ribosome silencing factor [Burkholderiaceae bacterium]
MDIRKLQRLVVDALEDVKGADIKVFNSMGLTQLFDRVIIASGTSNRQTKALAASVRDKVKAAGGHIVSVEGEETGEWVLVDLGDAIVHVMQPAIRAYYNLEEIWGAKPVSMKSLDDVEVDVARSAASRQAATADPERTTVARKSAAKKSATKKAPTKKAPTKKVVAKKAAVKKAAKKPSVKRVVAKKAAARKSPASR